MSFVLSNQISGSIRVIQCACPVDIEIYDSAGLLVGCVKDNVVSETESEKVYICVEETEKYLYLLIDDDYTIKIAGIDDGTMTYSVHELDMSSGETTSEIVYENVALTAGKQMSSVPSVTDVSQVPLYVLGDDGQPALEVLPDGNGTEVPFEPPVSCEHEYAEKITVPICTERGYTTLTCSKCGNSYTAALGHNYGAWTVTTPATSTTSGQQERVCSRCGDKQTSVIPATGSGGSSTPDYSSSSNGTPTYRIDVPTSFTGGSVSIIPTSASAGQRVTITVKPNSGYQLEKLTVTNGKNTELPPTDKGNGKYTFTMPSGKVTVDAVFQLIQPDEPKPETPWSNPFSDIADGEWYYDAVRFIQENGLMSGYGDSIFAPNANLPRAMLAQILYNKEGRPAVTGSAFTDVAEGEWYANAVTWAAERSIVSGYGNGLFGPSDNITREQLAVMLWRYAGEPAATDKKLHFNDADTASGYAVDALLWATENGIINGKGNGILAPKGLATRAQVAQMLMNCLEK